MKRCLGAVAAWWLSAVGMPGQAFAETWVATAILIKEQSAGRCSDNAPQATFTIEGGFLTLAGQYGKERVPIAADGTVKHDFKAANGNSLTLIGKVATKEFQLNNDRAACRYRYVVAR